MSVLPSARLLLLLALAAPLFLVNAPLALLVDLLLLVAAALDAARTDVGSLQVRRRAPRRVALGEAASVSVVLENQSNRRVRIRLTDDLPPALARLLADEDYGTRGSWSGEGAVDVMLGPREEVRLPYRVQALERGTAQLGDLHLRMLGPLGLVWRQCREPRQDAVRVQPGLRELRRYRLLAHRHRLREAGLRAMKERGEGSSFESLREYVRGDDPRRLDWKASGRRGTLIVRQMEAERSQNVLLAIDAGRLMTEELRSDDGVRRERLDAALSAALLLAEVAAQHGDRVGLLVFSDTVERFIPPSRLPLATLAEPLAEVRARVVEPDYPGAFAFLSRQLRRRSLIVLFTDVIDARASAALLAHAGVATRRHLPLAVAIRNPAVEEAAAAPPADDAAVYRRAAAEELLLQRSVALATMRRSGVLVADTLPDEAVPTAVNRYLEVKRRGRV